METQAPQHQTAAFSKLFDYAGLFPPAGLTMRETVGNFIRYQADAYSWMLNTLVVPAAKLGEFTEALQLLEKEDALLPTAPLPLSVLIADWDVEGPQVVEFQKAQYAKIVSAETKQLIKLDEISQQIERVYVELPVSVELPEQLDHISRFQGCAKIRTGGLTPEAFPSNEAVVRFVQACVERGVGFKATAGLHHPFAQARPASGAMDSPVVRMHGFVNVLLAVAAILREVDAEEAAAMLGRSQDAGLLPNEAADLWSQLASARTMFHSIGSCSFEEPVDDLRRQDWI